jgi:hypothetical protein
MDRAKLEVLEELKSLLSEESIIKRLLAKKEPKEKAESAEHEAEELKEKPEE